MFISSSMTPTFFPFTSLSVSFRKRKWTTFHASCFTVSHRFTVANKTSNIINRCRFHVKLTSQVTGRRRNIELPITFLLLVMGAPDLDERNFEKENVNRDRDHKKNRASYAKGKASAKTATKANTFPTATYDSTSTTDTGLCKMIDGTVVDNQVKIETKEKENRVDSEPVANWLDTVIDKTINEVVDAVDEEFVKEVFEIASKASAFVLKSVLHAIHNLDEALIGHLEDESDESDDEESDTDESRNGEYKYENDKNIKEVKEMRVAKTGKSKSNKMTSFVKLRRVVSGGAKQFSAKGIK